MSAELVELVQRLGQPRVLVIGDVMLDRYIWGDAARISQEAPVILLRAERREERLGGASSVATMLRALGAKVSLAGVVGEDDSGRRVHQLLADLCIDHEGVISEQGRVSTLKERYIGKAQHRHPQQMLRVDYEVATPIQDATEKQLCQVIGHKIRHADIVLISDYAKGVCTPNLLATVIAAAKTQGLRTLVDPQRGGDYRKYHGCSAMTPNRLEAGLATGLELNATAQVLAAGTHLLEHYDLEAAVVTLDKDGMALVHCDGRRKTLPTRPRQVYDITGAGDMVLSVLGMALAAGADYETAIALANIAGGLEVERVGVATVTRDEILRDLLHGGSPTAGNVSLGMEKVMTLPSLSHEVENRRRLGQRIAFTNGCFDILHAGHVEYLQAARARGDLLIVGLNSDASARSLKGPGRPINALDARVRVLTSLQAVDFVTVFDEPTPIELIKSLRPDVLVKGADYRKEDVVGGEVVESYGGEVYLVPLRPGYSTTGLLEKLRAA
jgi:D-beta-D-heptose 7-phosphate kinase/D-beta-D-heptose 1-phosphate adenosyltransferase